MIGRYRVEPCPVCDVEPCGQYELVVNVDGRDVERSLWPDAASAHAHGRARVAEIRAQLRPLTADDAARFVAALEALDTFDMNDPGVPRVNVDEATC